jgi:hypothetical protein
VLRVHAIQAETTHAAGIQIMVAGKLTESRQPEKEALTTVEANTFVSKLSNIYNAVLWSSGQTSWLQILRSEFDSWRY